MTRKDAPNAAGSAQTPKQAPGAPERPAAEPRPAGLAFDRDSYEVASTGRRVGAWLLDMLLVVVLLSIVAAILGAWQPVTRIFTNEDGTTWTTNTYYLDAIWSCSLMALFTALAIPFWAVRGATPAQRLLGLRVLDAGEPRLLSWPRAAARWFLLYGWTFAGIASAWVSAMSLLILIWLFSLLLTQMNGYRNQGFHDLRSHSLVVSPRRTHQAAWA